jgi:hypothetical protein
MDEFGGNPPPEMALFPADWYAQVLVRARRGPDAALAVARALEEAFATSVPGPREVEARRLVAWLRSLAWPEDAGYPRDPLALRVPAGS